jgi:uncharacterized protein DUF4238
MVARQHHYVPQCYLKGFARHREKPKLFVVDGKERRSFRTSPANVAVERDFHRIDVEGLAHDALENAFSGFESELSSALERIISARSINDANDRALLFNLIGLIYIKNPGMRETVRDFHERTAKIMLDLMTATPQRWSSQIRKAKQSGVVGEDADMTYEEIRKFVQEGKFKIKLANARHLHLELSTFDAILPYIFQRKWLLLKAPRKSAGFVTSDHPTCLMWSDPKRRNTSPPPGLGLRRTQLLFPISNELAAIGAFEADNNEMDASELLVAQFNGSVIVHSVRQVYARDDDFPYIMQHHSKIMRGRDLLRDQFRSRRAKPPRPG